MPTPDLNKKVVLQYVEAFNRGDLETLRTLFTPDAQVQGVLGWGGMDIVIPIWKQLHEAFRLQLQVEEMVAEGETVAVRYAERGQFVSPFQGHEPTGKHFELVAMEWFTFKDGKIYRRWGARDSASQARQIGLPLQ
jgi:steroid delta-isomerase-like uncharacterized protein